MAVAAAFLMKPPAGSAKSATALGGTIPPRGDAASLPLAGGSALQVLRDEMFAVDTDRLEGRLNDADYRELKAAYDVVLKRALARSGAVRADTMQVVSE